MELRTLTVSDLRVDPPAFQSETTKRTGFVNAGLALREPGSFILSGPLATESECERRREREDA